MCVVNTLLEMDYNCVLVHYIIELRNGTQESWTKC